MEAEEQLYLWIYQRRVSSRAEGDPLLSPTLSGGTEKKYPSLLERTVIYLTCGVMQALKVLRHLFTFIASQLRSCFAAERWGKSISK